MLLRAFKKTWFRCAVLLLAVGFLGDYWLFPALAQPGGRVVNRSENGLWLRYKWYFGEFSARDRQALAERAKRAGIRDLFFHVRSIDESGKLTYHYPDQARELNADLKRLAPGVRKVAWIYAGNSHGLGKVDLSRPQVRANMVAEANWLVKTCGFDGVQWDYEICPDGDVHLLQLLDETRAGLPKGTFVSVAVPTWYPFPLSGVGWSESYYRQVAQRCDQMAVMAYDTAAYSPRLYVWFVSEQVVRITRAASETRCKVLLGLPTYEGGTLSHNPRAENLRMSLMGVRNGLAGRANLGAWDGVALFADYTTDEEKWKEFKELWPR